MTKRILYGLLIFGAVSAACVLAGYGLTRYGMRQEQAVPNTVIETETVRDVENQAAANQEQIRPVLETSAPVQEYYLVSEAGFLLVFSSDRSTICLYTHIPITDFPEQERQRLMAGIWFPDMMEVYHYLESYTS